MLMLELKVFEFIELCCEPDVYHIMFCANTSVIKLTP
jgi:hypothetical protein